MAESTTGVKGFVKDASLGAIATTALELAVEATGVPFLNDPSPLPILEHQQTIMETILGGSGLILTTLGGLSVFAGESIMPGFGQTALAYGIGLLAGTSFYENQFVKWFGIRNIRHGV